MPFRSDKLRQRLALALTATVVTSLGRPDAVAHGETLSGAQCTSEVLPGARDSLTTTLLGRATRDTIEAGAGVVHGTMWMGSRRAIYGQVVRVDSMLGPGADLARRALTARQSTEVLVVPWGNNPGCGIDVWLQSALWTTPDSSGLFSLRLRPESTWVSGRPTFDAFYATRYSYAYGPYTVASRRVQGPDRSQTRREPLDDSGRGLRPVRRVTKRRTDKRLARERAPARLGPRESECANEVSG